MVWKALVVEKAAKAAKDSSRCALMGFIYTLKLAGIVSSASGMAFADSPGFAVVSYKPVASQR